MNTIAILAGGDSAEREISLRSGAAIEQALITGGYDVTMLDPAQPPDDYEEILSASSVVFPALHGSGGEDGTVQAWMEARGTPYVGADARASALCFDKQRCKQALQAAGMYTPAGQIVNRTDMWQSALLQAPFVLKPFDGGSSVDTFIIRDIGEMNRSAIETAFGRHPEMLLEELIEGTEITAAVLLDEALPIVEIIPPAGSEFDYENKYNGKTVELCPPQSIDAETQTRARQLALQVHKLLGVRDLSRTDMIVTGDGTLYVLELNTMPGMTAQSLLPKAAAAAGYTMPELATKLVRAATARRSADRPV